MNTTAQQITIHLEDIDTALLHVHYALAKKALTELIELVDTMDRETEYFKYYHAY